ncbi:MAG: response regulator [Deltaproteobacteria bacterium]|nr:response regulator [Deltaproteobacteria bacterium]
MKVLVVDDSMTMRKVVATYLQGMGVSEVDQAENGAQAVEMAAKTEYACIFLDWNMPVLLGIDALRAIRASGNQVPVVMVTTETEKRSVVQAIKDGASDYLMKPFQKDAFVERARRHLKL